MSEYKIDELDRKILSFLVNDARKPFLEIARACGVSGAAIHQRVKRLEDNGIISGFSAHVKPSAIGLPVCAFISLNLSQADRLTEVVEQLKRIPEIVECHFITGRASMLIKAHCASYDHLMEIIINGINKIDSVQSTETMISLIEPFERQVGVHQEVPEITWKA